MSKKWVKILIDDPLGKHACWWVRLRTIHFEGQRIKHKYHFQFWRNTNTNTNTNNLLPQPHNYSQNSTGHVFSHVHIIIWSWVNIRNNSTSEFRGDLGECTIISWPMDWQYGRGYKPLTTVSIPYIYAQLQIPTPRQWAKAITVQNIAWLGRDKQDREKLSVFACGPRRVRCGPCDLRVLTDNDTHKLRVIHQGPPGHSQGRGQWENPEGGGNTATVGGTCGRKSYVTRRKH
jgi:hypothetical protein